MSVTYHVVVPFGRDPDGNVVPLEPKEAPSSDAARWRARQAALSNAGAIAFSRTGDLASGEFDDAVILATYGEVDQSLLME